jgi:hypothetical protein
VEISEPAILRGEIPEDSQTAAFQQNNPSLTNHMRLLIAQITEFLAADRNSIFRGRLGVGTKV